MDDQEEKKRREFNYCIRSGKSEAQVANNRILRSILSIQGAQGPLMVFKNIIRHDNVLALE